MEKRVISLLGVVFLLFLTLPIRVVGAPPPGVPPIGSDSSSQQIVVRFKTGTTPSELAGIHRQARGSPKETIAGIGVQVLTVPTGKVAQTIMKYAAHPLVMYAEPDYIAEVAAQPDDTYFGAQWSMQKVRAPEAWATTTGSAGVNIAVLDTGVDADHPDLADKIITNVNFSDSLTADDVYGHGTHVAGIAAASTNNGIGVAGLGYDSSIMNVKVLRDNGSGYHSWIAAGIIWAADNGAQVINLSLGGGESSHILEDAVNYAWTKGALVVAAAGNNGNSYPVYPAGYTNCIAVAATDRNDAKASWSNYGDWIDVAAPGSGIYSTSLGNSYRYMAGTSMASPHVAGLAALVFTTVTDLNGNGLLNDEVRSRIESTCADIGVSDIGHGRINAATAVWSDNTDPQPSVQIIEIADPTTVSEAGSVVTYTYTVTNTGEVTLTGILVSDDKLGHITLPTTTLAPGTSTSGIATYTVTQADIDSGADIINTATVTTDQDVIGSDIATVIIEVPRLAEVTILPADQIGRGWTGEDVVYMFTVENTGDVRDAYAISVACSWPSSVTPQSLTLEPQGTATVTITHSVPERVSPGEFDAGTLSVVSGESGASVSASFTTTARVSAVEVAPAEQSGTGAPGEMIEYTYTISNAGTESEVYSLVVAADWEASLSATSVPVEAGGSTTVVVSHTIVAGVEGGNSDTGTLTVASAKASASAVFTTTAREAEEEPATPVIDLFEVTYTVKRTWWSWIRWAVEWDVSDADGNLATVEIVTTCNGKTVDSTILSVTGDAASGEYQWSKLIARGRTYEITMIVTDTDGNCTSRTELIKL